MLAASKFSVGKCRIMDPIMFGDYPVEMQEILGSRLPLFSMEDRKKLRYKADFIGINHYSTLYAKDCIYSYCTPGTTQGDSFVFRTGVRQDGVPIGEPVG